MKKPGKTRLAVYWTRLEVYRVRLGMYKVRLGMYKGVRMVFILSSTFVLFLTFS
jgi:hypothetical protein